MNCSGFGIFIPFSRSVTMSRILHLFFATTFASCCSISIAFHCASTILYTYVAYCTFNYTFVDNCSSFATTFSYLMSIYIICASTKCCSSTLSLILQCTLNVLSVFLHANIVYFCAKTQLQMF